MEAILKYFPELTPLQLQQYEQVIDLYKEWNTKINVISRKDIEHLATRHVLHSLGIAKVQPFLPQTQVLDVGTGGGFPGIPLAILFPETDFFLVDSIGKKIKVVQDIAQVLQLKNVKAEQLRAETISQKFDFVVSRAVTQMPEFVTWVSGKFKKKSLHQRKNGILYLKGGDLTAELASFPKAEVFNLENYFSEDFFDTKKVVYLPM